MSPGCPGLILCVRCPVLHGSLLPSEHPAGWVSTLVALALGGSDGSKGSYPLPIVAPLRGWPWGFALVLFLCLTSLLRGCWNNRSQELYFVYLKEAQ